MLPLLLSFWFAPPAFDASFYKVWGDGQAELAGYELTYPRYGASRKGTAVTIFVAETFSNRLRVKADAGRHPKSDEFPVMKLNLVKDFPTGIYDYNEQTSVFVALQAVNGRPAGSVTKQTFSSQEWCGSVWQQLRFEANKVSSILHSYFDGEADETRDLPYPAEGLTEDQLIFWARGMAGPALAPGESKTLPLLPALEASRHEHKPLAWTRVTLRRSKTNTQLKTPAGTYNVDTYEAQIENGPRRSYSVEPGIGGRLVQWETSNGEKAVLLGVARLKYWELNRPGGEAELQKLGLKPRGARMP